MKTQTMRPLQPPTICPTPWTGIDSSYQFVSLDGSPRDPGFQLVKTGHSLGAGTFGRVEEAKLFVPGADAKYVAVKEVFSNPAYKNREYDIQRRLRHTNLVKIEVPGAKLYYDEAAEEEPAPRRLYQLIITEVFDMDLAKLLRHEQSRTRILPMRLVQAFAAQLLEGVAYLARKGVAHRDLKPENIFLRREDSEGNHIRVDKPSRDSFSYRLAIGDFGNAKVLKDPNERSITYICTKTYRAPELLLGQVSEQAKAAYGTQVDIWSVACIIGELITNGEPIFNLQPHRSGGMRHVGAELDLLPLAVQMAMMIGPPSMDDLEGMGYDEKQAATCQKYFARFQKTNPVKIEVPGTYTTEFQAPSIARVLQYRCHERNRAGDYGKPLATNPMQRVTVELLSLLGCMFQWSPVKRWTADDLLQHPFFTTPINEQILMALH